MTTWPQWVFLALSLVGFGIIIARFGQRKTDHYDWGDIIGHLIGFWLLWMGGFFSPIGW